MKITLYGIKNCDTMKKARAWLDENDIAYNLHDYKKEGIDREHLEVWCATLGWEKILNKASTTFRKLPNTAKQRLSKEQAIALMLEHPTVIKRPILDQDGVFMTGFKPDNYTTFFNKA